MVSAILRKLFRNKPLLLTVTIVLAIGAGLQIGIWMGKNMSSGCTKEVKKLSGTGK